VLSDFQSMYNSEDSIGVDATDYLLDLGFDCGPSIEYVGDCVIDDEILADDSHPKHSQMMEEYVENTLECIQWISNEYVISICWSSAEIISYSDGFPAEILTTLKEFIDSNDKIIYVSNEKLTELESGS